MVKHVKRSNTKLDKMVLPMKMVKLAKMVDDELLDCFPWNFISALLVEHDARKSHEKKKVVVYTFLTHGATVKCINLKKV